MKFSEMPYVRPNLDEVKEKLTACAKRIEEASCVEEQIAAFDESENISMHINSTMSLAYVRNTIDTTDAFYEAEREFMDEAGPELEEVGDQINTALLNSKFRAALEAHYGKLLFKNLEIEKRSFKPELIPLMQEESKL